MHNLPIVPTQVTLRKNLCSLDASTGHNYSHFALGDRVLHLEGCEWSQKFRKNRYARSAHCAHTGYVKGKCGFSGLS